MCFPTVGGAQHVDAGLGRGRSGRGTCSSVDVVASVSLGCARSCGVPMLCAVGCSPKQHIETGVNQFQCCATCCSPSPRLPPRPLLADGFSSLSHVERLVGTQHNSNVSRIATHDACQVREPQALRLQPLRVQRTHTDTCKRGVAGQEMVPMQRTSKISRMSFAANDARARRRSPWQRYTARERVR